MTQQDNLFQEVEEDLERQKMENLWRRYGVWIMAGAIGIVLITGSFTLWDHWKENQRQRATAGLVHIFNEDKTPDQRIAALEDFAKKTGGETQATFARLAAASLAAKDGHTDQAVQLYDAIAHDPNADPAFRQYGDLLAVQVQLDSGDPAALSKRLDPLTQPTSAWRYSALEYQGYLALRANDKAKARSIFNQLSHDASAPHSLSARADDVLRALGD